MTGRFTHAVVSRIPDSFQTRHSQCNLENARKQHEAYVRLLRELGLDVIELPPDEALPECVFVEDTAVVCNGIALIARPGAPHRVKEIDTIRVVMKKELDMPIVEMADQNAKLCGGDVLFTGQEFFVGLSDETNEGGARAVASAFPEYPCTPIKIPAKRRLKSFVTMGGNEMLCVGAGKEPQEVLKRMEREATFSYKTLTLPDDNAANVLYLNGTLVHRSNDEIPSSFEVAYSAWQSLEKKFILNLKVSDCDTVFCNKIDYTRRSVNISELVSLSSGLSSSCLLVKRPRHIRNL